MEQTQKKKRKEALTRARGAAREERERDLELKRRAKRRERISFLNASFPGCKACESPYMCPGFVADSFRPAFCLSCGHERDAHILARDYNDKGLTDRMLADFEAEIKAILEQQEAEMKGF